MTALKILVTGDVCSNAELQQLLARVVALQQSHGPFGCLLCSGSLFADGEGFKLSVTSPSPAVYPIPTYLFDSRGIPKEILMNKSLLPPNLNVVIGANGNSFVGLATVCKLTVAFIMNYSDSVTPAIAFKEVQDIVSNNGYRGCDLLLSNEWPADMHHFLPDSDLQVLKECGVGVGVGSTMIADFAAIVKPRYHIATGRKSFYQRPPYRNDGAVVPVTRFVALCGVNGSKAKNGKWLHALSLEPIIHMTSKDIADVPAGTTDNPYASNSIITQPLKKFKPDPSMTQPMIPGSIFYGSKGQPRHGSSNNNPLPRTLFVSNIPIGVSDKMIMSQFPGSATVRRPEGKHYAFLEFISHTKAKEVFDISQQQPVVIAGKSVSIGWGKEKDAPSSRSTYGNSLTSGDALGAPVVVEPPSLDAKVIFVGSLPLISDTNSEEITKALKGLFPEVVKTHLIPNKTFGFLDFDNFDAANYMLAKYRDKNAELNGRELLLGWAKAGADKVMGGRSKYVNLVPPSQDVKTLCIRGLPETANIENVFKDKFSTSIFNIARPQGKDYAFLEFDSHASALMVMETVHGSGGSLIVDDKEVSIGWSNGRPMDKRSKSTLSDDCWFCLASKSVKVHLIASIGEHSYVSLPRGGVADNHVIVTPIDCVPNRLLLSATAKAELKRYGTAIENFHQSNSQATLTFERAIRTKGRDHMHEQFIPVPTDLIAQAITSFTKAAENYQLHFHEIFDPIKDADEFVLNDIEGGPYQEFFYISIPVDDAGAHRRFVYVHESDKNHRFPMHFGLEVAANALNRPERANWKNCLLSENEEVTATENFRKVFERFDPNNQEGV